MFVGLVQFTSNQSCCAQNETYDSSFTVVYITFVFVAINILGNSFALIILFDRIWNKSVFTTILKAISVFEIMFNFFVLINYLSFLSEPLQPFLRYGDTVVAAVEMILLLIDSFVIGCQMARNWSVTILALFRYDMICRATVMRRNNAPNNNSFFSNKILPPFFIMMLIFCVSISIPRMFESYPIICLDNAIICNWENNWKANIFYQYAYFGVVMFVFQSGGPVIITSYVSFMVIRKIQQRRKIRKRQGIANDTNNNKSNTKRNTGNAQRNPGNLVLAVCITFAVLELPSFYSKLEESIFSTGSSYFKYIANYLIFLDSSLNLIIYLASNRTFRQLSINRILCRPNVLDNGDTQTLVRQDTKITRQAAEQ